MQLHRQHANFAHMQPIMQSSSFRASCTDNSRSTMQKLIDQNHQRSIEPQFAARDHLAILYENCPPAIIDDIINAEADQIRTTWHQCHDTMSSIGAEVWL